MILLKAGYHFIRQFPISGILMQERSRYYKAIRAAQDPENGYDFTYFLEYYAAMLEKSVESIHAHVAKAKQLEHLAPELGQGEDGIRQLRGMKWLIQEDISTITTEAWRKKFKVSFETARQDLHHLQDLGALKMRAPWVESTFLMLSLNDTPFLPPSPPAFPMHPAPTLPPAESPMG